jgi:hypothetical protein
MPKIVQSKDEKRKRIHFVFLHGVDGEDTSRRVNKNMKETIQIFHARKTKSN